MNKFLKIFIIVIICIIIGIIAFFIFKSMKQNDAQNVEIYQDEEINIVETELSEEEKLKQRVDEKLASMTLKEKIGQMIVVSYRSSEYTEELDGALKEVQPGGFILFSENVTTYDETVEYISKIKSTASIPMLISIDQEGGRVQRIKSLADIKVQNIPAMFEIGKKNDKELSYNVGKVLAREIAAFGINTDYAPILDIFSNPNNTVIGTRAFGSDSQTVINNALPFAEGMSSEGVIPVYKHFPGHGDTVADSHVELPVVTKTKEQLYENELLTFKAAIENKAQMIMTAHIALPNITGDYIPATLSKDIINGILRNELGFDGVVITDAINMKALQDNYTLEEICKYSINAGVDMILMPLSSRDTASTIESLVNNGAITEARINESVSRILKLKYENKLDEEKILQKENIGTQENIDIINKITE